MKPIIRSIATAPDKDAEYVLRRIKLIEECDKAINDRARERDAARLEAGLRLIEVRERWASSGQRACPEFARWLQAHGIGASLASNLMRDAGFNGGSREERTQKDAERKRRERALHAPKARAETPQHIVIQEPCDDCDTEEERWQRSFGNLAGDAISMTAFWTREFGREWEAYAVTSDMITLAEQAAASWQQLLNDFSARRAR